MGNAQGAGVGGPGGCNVATYGHARRNEFKLRPNHKANLKIVSGYTKMLQIILLKK